MRKNQNLEGQLSLFENNDLQAGLGKTKEENKKPKTTKRKRNKLEKPEGKENRECINDKNDDISLDVPKGEKNKKEKSQANKETINQYYDAAVALLENRGVLRIGVLQSRLHISSRFETTIMDKMIENGLMDSKFKKIGDSKKEKETEMQ